MREEEAGKADPGDGICRRRWLGEIEVELDSKDFDNGDDDDDHFFIRICDIKVRISNQLREEGTEVHHAPF